VFVQTLQEDIVYQAHNHVQSIISGVSHQLYDVVAVHICQEFSHHKILLSVQFQADVVKSEFKLDGQFVVVEQLYHDFVAVMLLHVLQ